MSSSYCTPSRDTSVEANKGLAEGRRWKMNSRDWAAQPGPELAYAIQETIHETAAAGDVTSDLAPRNVEDIVQEAMDTIEDTMSKAVTRVLEVTRALERRLDAMDARMKAMDKTVDSDVTCPSEDGAAMDGVVDRHVQPPDVGLSSMPPYSYLEETDSDDKDVDAGLYM